MHIDLHFKYKRLKYVPLYTSQVYKIKIYNIGLHFKPIQIYAGTIDLYFKAKSSVYILSLKHKKQTFFINFKAADIFEN